MLQRRHVCYSLIYQSLFVCAACQTVVVDDNLLIVNLSLFAGVL